MSIFRWIKKRLGYAEEYCPRCKGYGKMIVERTELTVKCPHPQCKDGKVLVKCGK